jgi:hypothetical protein
MAFRRDALPHMRLSAVGFEIETQLVAHAVRAGLRIAEVPSFEARRLSGTSNLHTVRDGTRVLRELLLARMRRWPPHGAGDDAWTAELAELNGHRRAALSRSQEPITVANQTSSG